MNIEAFQTLSRIGRLGLGCFPTPVQQLHRTSPLLSIKRDDYSGPGFGGNKVRKLEYVLGDAVIGGYKTVLTTGGIRSNHCRITAALCAQEGLRCILVLNGKPVSPKPASLALDEWYGAEIVYVASREERAPALQRLAAERDGYVIPLGASNALGALGFVRAVQELTDKPARIVHSTSSGGTQAGLAAGLWLRGWRDVELIGISADDPASAIETEIRAIFPGIAGLLELPGDAFADVPVRVLDNFAGSGYGIPTPEGTKALRQLARQHGIVLDPVYTAKAMAGCLTLLEFEPKPTLFWHTGGQLALFDLSAGSE